MRDTGSGALFVLAMQCGSDWNKQNTLSTRCSYHDAHDATCQVVQRSAMHEYLEALLGSRIHVLKGFSNWEARQIVFKLWGWSSIVFYF